MRIPEPLAANEPLHKGNFRGMPKNHIRSGKRMTAVPDFIGVDGEGVTNLAPALDWYDADGNLYPGKTHDYVLLSVGSESFHWNGSHLTTYSIFEFLWDQFLANPNGVFVGYYLSYDFTQWLRDLPYSRARMLLSKDGINARKRKIGRNSSPFPVEWEGWEFDLLDLRRFKLRRKGAGTPWMWICDCGPFFQTSFLNAIDPKKWPTPILSESEFETIKRGKESRSDAAFDPTMIRYNVLENNVLSRLMTVTFEGFRAMDVKLRNNQWFGPGQAAQVWLNNIKAPDKDVAKYNVPVEVLDAAHQSYYGGWFEIFAHGHIPGIVYEYDINSAYPHIIADLPCLEHGEWHNKWTANPRLTLVHAEVWGSDPRIGTMPHRTKKGAILRPHHTSGWYWHDELEAARHAGCIDRLEYHDVWTFQQHCSHKPFKQIRELYYDRQRIGKDTAHGKSLKLVYNSAYGKLAQSVGDPKYSNPIYASLVTSGTRKTIWNAIGTHPSGAAALTMVATDAVYFRRVPHPLLSLSSDLGAWEQSERINMCQFMPGLYWDDKARQGGTIKSRGVNAADLRQVIALGDERFAAKRNRLELHWRDDYPQLRSAMGDDWTQAMWSHWPMLTVPIRFGMVSARLAIHRNDWSQAGSISNRPRFISSDPSDKRDTSTAYVQDNVIWTRPYETGPDGVESTPYDKRFGLELKEGIIADDIVTPDGHVDDEIYEFVRTEGIEFS